MNQPKKIETEELDKLHAVVKESQQIGAFLDWLQNERGIMLASYDVNDDLYPANTSIDKLLAEYYKIDLRKVEAEKLQLLEEVRALYDKPG